jgi:hypothetical protein
LALGDPEGRYEARTQYEIMLLKGLLRMTLPEQWEEIKQLEERLAKDPKLRAPG